ncbi:hypothetical protein E2C01_077377 [Portunus trituberculatus]|uniref:Uncharacterized protein n=1 Tax=Portunus trituberculatus TaxID=210409 RepID=A0A5B7IM42_PORTR|nr:hypothetical protein [Portunus trituberculatus]
MRRLALTGIPHSCRVKRSLRAECVWVTTQETNPKAAAAPECLQPDEENELNATDKAFILK